MRRCRWNQSRATVLGAFQSRPRPLASLFGPLLILAWHTRRGEDWESKSMLPSRQNLKSSPDPRSQILFLEERQ